MDRTIKGLLVSVYFISFNLLHNTISVHCIRLCFILVFVIWSSFFLCRSFFSSVLFSRLFFYYKKYVRSFYPLNSVSKMKILNKWVYAVDVMACHTGKCSMKQGLMGIRPSSTQLSPQACQVDSGWRKKIHTHTHTVHTTSIEHKN